MGKVGGIPQVERGPQMACMVVSPMEEGILEGARGKKGGDYRKSEYGGAGNFLGKKAYQISMGDSSSWKKKVARRRVWRQRFILLNKPRSSHQLGKVHRKVLSAKERIVSLLCFFSKKRSRGRSKFDLRGAPEGGGNKKKKTYLEVSGVKNTEYE